MKKNFKRLLLFPFNILFKVNPVFEQKLMFHIKCKRKLDLKNPKSYNEKLGYLKLFYRNDKMPICADKFAAREYIKQNGFGSFLPKLYWHGNDARKIPFDSLPDSFVIKSTSGSGNNIIVRDKKKIDFRRVVKTANKWMKEKYLPAYGEWHYSKIKPSIIIEEYLDDRNNFVPIDYKLFCFNSLNNDITGNVGCVAVDSGRFIAHKRNIYDSNWSFLEDVSFGFDVDKNATFEKPQCYQLMCEIATKLSSPFPHARIDFFIVNEKLYIGEITFFNGAGYDVVSPFSFNLLMGSWIDLNSF